MAGMMTFCSAAISAAKSILQILHLTASRFSHEFLQDSFTANGGFDPAWKMVLIQ